MIFGVPLDRQHKAPAGEFNRFDGAIFRISGAYSHPWCKPRDRLVVPRVHLPSLRAGDTLEQGARFDRHAVCGQTFVRSAPHMASGRWQVLDEAASQMHVQDLQPPANREQGKIAS